jgi:hypothetical protein
MARRVNLGAPGPWQTLFGSALTLTDHLARMIRDPFWTFGGGTVLMLRLNHRASRDIDLFVPDPQYLGHVTPRLSDPAEGLTSSYVETAEYVKLLMPTGEIDIVVGEPLTDDPFELVTHRGRRIRVETSAEIIAKKMHHRGHHAKARDLFDLCAVADGEPEAIGQAAPFFARHGRTFIERIKSSADLVEEEFAQIGRIAYRRPFEECVTLAEGLISAAL